MNKETAIEPPLGLTVRILSVFCLQDMKLWIQVISLIWRFTHRSLHQLIVSWWEDDDTYLRISTYIKLDLYLFREPNDKKPLSSHYSGQN